MDVIIMDDELKSLYNLDVFESLIWAERYIGYGNFEFYTPMNQNMFEVIDAIQKKKKNNLDCYVWLKETDSSMFIEELQITTDVENGNHLTISGRGLETILERRIIRESISFDGNFQDGIEKIINDSIISPSTRDRMIENFIFKRSDNDYINNLAIHLECDIGSNLYDVILKMCEEYQIGFDIYLRSDNKFVFSLTYGVNRSFDQNNNPYVIFSTKYENLINSDYLESNKLFKNTAFVVGDDKWGLISELTVGIDTGLSRKEIYVDAKDIQFEEYYKPLEDDKQTLNDYKQQLEDQLYTLSQLISESTKISDDHYKKVEEYEQIITDHRNRVNSLNQRMTYYLSKKTEYVDNLDENQRFSYERREACKIEIEEYDYLIKECNDRIDGYNNKLQNEMELTYDKIVQYEDGTKFEESKKKKYEDKKNISENNKRTEEEKLPEYEEKLKTYEDMISKYEGIISDDQQTISTTTGELNKENSDYNTTISEYDKLKFSYQDQINDTKELIKVWEDKTVKDEKILNNLYKDFLSQKATEKLSENTYMKAFTSEIEATNMFVYGKDFFKGDIVQITNEYGMEDKVRVSEIVMVNDTNGYNMYPTFQVVA